MSDITNLINTSIYTGTTYEVDDSSTTSLLFDSLSSLSTDTDLLSAVYNTNVTTSAISAMDSLDYLTLESILQSTSYNTSSTLFSSTATSVYDSSLALLDSIYSYSDDALDMYA